MRSIEARSIDWVPETERHGRIWHQAPLWFLGNFQYFSIPIGFVGPSLGLSLGWTVLAGVLGILTGTVFMAFHAAQGPALGLPQMIQSRAQFGYRGVIVPLFATAFTYVAFNVADQVLLAEGLNGAFGWNKDVVAVVCCAGAALLAIYGHDWVHRIFRALLCVSFPLMTVLTIGVVIGAAGGEGGGEYGFTLAAFMAQFSAAAAYNITYAPYVSDYSRYLPRETTNRSIIASVFFGAAGSAIWLIALGAWLAVRLGADDGLVGLMTAGNNVIGGLGDLAAFFSAAALAATMGMNAYGGMLSVLTAVDSARPIKPGRRARALTILGLAVVWFAVGKSISASAVSTVLTALTLMLYLLVPWTAANLVDFFFVRRGRYVIADLFDPRGRYGVWAPRGLIAYGLAFLAMIPFMVLPHLGGWSYTGPLAKALGDVDVAWIVGLAVAGGVYWGLCRSLEVEREVARGAGMSFTPPDPGAAPRFTGIRTFARAPHVAGPEGVDAAIIGVPFDTATSMRPGARFGPAGIRDASLLLRPWNTAQGVDVFGSLSLADLGDLTTTPGNAERTTEQIAAQLEPVVRAGAVPLVLGGDHSIVLGELRAHHAVHGPLAVVLLDAHADTWEEYWGERYFHGTPFRRALEEGLIDPARSLLAGMRGSLYAASDLDEPRSWGFEIVSCDELRTWTAAEYAARVRSRVGDGPAFLSFDIDVIDPAFAPATGTPEVCGLLPHEAIAFVRALRGQRFTGYDLVEVAPAYDTNAQLTALLAANIAYELLTLTALAR